MQCPVCDRPMISLELHEIEVDHCVACGGVWLDAGELELLLDGAANRDRIMAELRSHAYLAFAAGLLSVLTPCVLPLMPAYLSLESAI